MSQNCGFNLIGGLAPVPGAALPLGVNAIPPNALGVFLSQQNGFADRSGGAGLLFRVANYHDIDEASAVVRSSVQFVRLGPIATGMMGLPLQLPLVRIYVLNSMTSAEQLLGGFTLGG